MSQKSTQPGRERVGHFTQMVCKASRKVGYGIAIGKSSNGSINTWLVDRYTPPGNFNSAFTTNVKRLRYSGKDEKEENDDAEFLKSKTKLKQNL